MILRLINLKKRSNKVDGGIGFFLLILMEHIHMSKNMIQFIGR